MVEGIPVCHLPTSLAFRAMQISGGSYQVGTLKGSQDRPHVAPLPCTNLISAFYIAVPPGNYRPGDAVEFMSGICALSSNCRLTCR